MAVLMVGLVLVGGVAGAGDFRQNFDMTWGGQRAKIFNGGKLLSLSLDKVSGSGFQSKSEYLFGRIDMQLKLVAGDSAGTVTAYYVCSKQCLIIIDSLYILQNLFSHFMKTTSQDIYERLLTYIRPAEYLLQHLYRERDGINTFFKSICLLIYIMYLFFSCEYKQETVHSQEATYRVV